MSNRVNGSYILDVLQKINAPATLKDILKAVAFYEHKPAKLLRKHVEMILKNGVESGFIQKVNRHYYSIMHAAQIFDEMSSDDETHNRKRRPRHETGLGGRTRKNLGKDVLKSTRSPAKKRVRPGSEKRPNYDTLMDNDIAMDDLKSETATVGEWSAELKHKPNVRHPANEPCWDTFLDDDDNDINERDVDGVSSEVSVSGIESDAFKKSARRVQWNQSVESEINLRKCNGEVALDQLSIGTQCELGSDSQGLEGDKSDGNELEKTKPSDSLWGPTRKAVNCARKRAIDSTGCAGIRSEETYKNLLSLSPLYTNCTDSRNNSKRFASETKKRLPARICDDEEEKGDSEVYYGIPSKRSCANALVSTASRKSKLADSQDELKAQNSLNPAKETEKPLLNRENKSKIDDLTMKDNIPTTKFCECAKFTSQRGNSATTISESKPAVTLDGPAARDNRIPAEESEKPLRKSQKKVKTSNPEIKYDIPTKSSHSTRGSRTPQAVYSGSSTSDSECSTTCVESESSMDSFC